MYNMDFYKQLQESKRYLFGSGDPRTVSDRLHAQYMPPPTVKAFECKEDINGEWVPFPASLEKKVSEPPKKN